MENAIGIGLLVFAVILALDGGKVLAVARTTSSAGSTATATGGVSPPPSAATGNAIRDAITWARTNGADPLALLYIMQVEGGPSTNQNCGGGATCSGYFQLNNRLYGGQYTPGNVFSELAVPGVGNRILSRLQQYGAGWTQSLARFWADAQGGQILYPDSYYQTAYARAQQLYAQYR